MAEELLGSAKVKISYDDLNRLDMKIDQSGRKFTAETDKMSKGLKGLTAIIGTVGVVKFGADIIKASTHMDSINRMLLNVEGSQEKANNRFEQFRILAKEPVLDPFNLSRFYVSLKSVNVEGDLSIRFMKSLANAMAGVGAGNTEFARSMEQFTQMMGKATLQGQDLRVVAESFPQIRKYLAEAFGGLTDPEAIAKAGYKSIDVLTRLNEVMEKSPKFAGGAQAAQENFTQSLELFYATLGKDVLPIITKFLNNLTDLMDEFGKLDAPIKKVIGTAVVGGVGLLGIASAIGAIKIALDGLGMSAGLKVLMGLGAKTAVAGGAIGLGEAVTKRVWVPNAPGTAVSAPGYVTGAYKDVITGGAAGGAVSAFSKITSVALTVAKATIAVGAAAFVGFELSKLLPYPEFAKPSPKPGAPFTPEEQKKLDKLMKPIIASMIGTESPPEMQAIVEKNKIEIAKSLPAGKPAIPLQIEGEAVFEGFKKWESIQGEGYYATIDEKIAKLKELRDAHQLEPIALREVNNMITDLLSERNDIYKQSYDEWQEILKSGQKQGFDIVTRGYEDIISKIGMQKIPVMMDTGAFTVGFELPETAKREIPRLPEKKPTIMEFMGTEDDLERLREWFAEQARLAKLNEDMIALSGELARKDEEYIAGIKEKTQALDKAGMSAEDYAKALENIKKTAEEKAIFKAKLEITTDEAIKDVDEAINAEIIKIGKKYIPIYLEAERLEVPKEIVDKAKEAEIRESKPYQEKWILSVSEGKALDSRVNRAKEIIHGIKKESKEVSEFWRQIGREGLSMIESISDKKVESVFGKLFEKSDIDEAFKDYKLSQEMIRDEDERTGRAFEKGYDLQTMSFHEFSSQYRKEAELNTQSWSEFCKSMVEEFTKALVKMEIEAEAKNLWNLVGLGGKTEKGTEGGGGKTDWLTKLSEGAGITGTVAKGAKYIKGLGKSEEIAGGVAPTEAGTTGGVTAASVAAVAIPAAMVATFAGVIAYDQYKQHKAFEEQKKDIPEMQLKMKERFKEQFHMGKYEDVEKGVYANAKGYESTMRKLGIEPYPLAKGGMGIVTRPTPFIMGEAGPEIFNIQPLSKVQNEYITNKKDTYVNGNRSDNFNVYISFPNATLDSVDQNQIDRFVAKAVPSLRRAVSNGELS